VTVQANAIFLMTCSIREGAEQKIWKRLEILGRTKRKSTHRGHESEPITVGHQSETTHRHTGEPFTIGVLGCMAERLKERIFERCADVDIVCGPDAYRDLPRLLAEAESGHHASAFCVLVYLRLKPRLFCK
jgi:tRNA A37 methylthiotransferase MiaB